ncbi:MAG: hypothetical protein LBB86_06075 [Oscillospiraceae bacterium]|nr:hypothetical protein [Oscillospiraceae bacterium]
MLSRWRRNRSRSTIRRPSRRCRIFPQPLSSSGSGLADP